jgi:hypothetical protein
VVVPAGCKHCGQRLPEPAGGWRGRAWWHQVVELLPLAVRVTEYQVVVRCCVPFSGRYRLSRREVRQALLDFWGVRLSLGAIVRQEQAESIALAPVVAEARAAVPQAPVVNMDETG